MDCESENNCYDSDSDSSCEGDAYNPHKTQVLKKPLALPTRKPLVPFVPRYEYKIVASMKYDEIIEKMKKYTAKTDIFLNDYSANPLPVKFKMIQILNLVEILNMGILDKMFDENEKVYLQTCCDQQYETLIQFIELNHLLKTDYGRKILSANVLLTKDSQLILKYSQIFIDVLNSYTQFMKLVDTPEKVENILTTCGTQEDYKKFVIECINEINQVYKLVFEDLIAKGLIYPRFDSEDIIENNTFDYTDDCNGL